MSLLMEALKKAEQAKRETTKNNERDTPDSKSQNSVVDTKSNKPAEGTSPENALNLSVPTLENVIDPGTYNDNEPEISSEISADNPAIPNEQEDSDEESKLLDGFETDADITNSISKSKLEYESSPNDNLNSDIKVENNGYHSVITHSNIDSSIKLDILKPDTTSAVIQDAIPEHVAKVLSAKIPPPRTSRLIGLFIFSSVTFIIILAVAGYFYYQSESHSLQAQIAIPPIRQSISQPTDNLADSNIVAEPTDKHVELEQSKPVKIVSAKKAPAASKPNYVHESKSSSKTLQVENSKQTTVQSNPVEEPKLQFNIRHEKEPDDIYQMLSQAYQAYQSGKNGVAMSIYRDILGSQPENRDAMLGLAAASIRNNEFEVARDIYIQLLRSDPKDTISLAGLVNIQGNIDPVENETQIKLLLDKVPESPYLLFTLGSLYANQQRWPEAQQTFFKAFHADNKNADYAYNLAVALDHMGQRQAALDYYRVALDLVKSKPISFDINSVHRRIQEILGQQG